MSGINLAKTKEVIDNNPFLFKAILFIIVLVIEILLIKLTIDTSATKSFKYLGFNFKSTELPLYFFLILLVVAKDKLFNLKIQFNRGSYLYLISHAIMMGVFYFYTMFVIKNPDLVAGNIALFKISWYAAGLIPIALLFLFFFSFNESKNIFLLLKKEITISVILAFLVLYLFGLVSLYFADIGLIAARIAMSLLQKVSGSLTVTEVGPALIKLRSGSNAVNFSSLCSGIIGYAFFMFFSLLYYIVNMRTINKIRYVVTFFVGFVIFFVIDIIRNFTFLFVWTIYPSLGVELFHSNLRPIYYTISVLIVFFIFRNWIKNNTSQKNKV